MSVSNTIEAKLYFFWKIVHNIESFIFSNGVLLPFGKKRFFLCLYWPPPYPNTCFHYFVCLGFDSENTMESHIPCLKSLFMYINFPRNSFLLKSSRFLHCLNASKYFALNLQKNVWKCKWTKIKIKTNKKHVK